MKKLLSVLFLLASSIALTFSAFASETTTYSGSLSLFQEGKFPAASYSDASLYADSCEEVITEGLASFAKSIDVSEFSLPPTDVLDLCSNIINTHPEFFHVGNGMRVSYSGNSTLSVVPNYKMTADEYAVKKKIYDKGLAHVLSDVKDSMTDLQKILSVHDRIVSDYEYDTSLTNYDAYSFLAEGKGVCQSYSLVFLAAMKEIGIECAYASSESMNHMWNIVCVGGEWYHLDVTWDDPVYDIPGRVKHTFFLLDDETIGSAGYYADIHENWVCSYSCTDKAYINTKITSSNAPFVFLDNVWYCIDQASLSLCTYDFESDAVTPVVKIPGRWFAFGSTTSYYPGVFSGLAKSGETLYFNSYNKLYKYTPSSKLTETLTPVLSEGYIYSLRADGMYLEYVLKKSPSVTAAKVCCICPFKPNGVFAQELCITDADGNAVSLSDITTVKVSADALNSSGNAVSPIFALALYSSDGGTKKLTDIRVLPYSGTLASGERKEIGVSFTFDGQSADSIELIVFDEGVFSALASCGLTVK